MTNAAHLATYLSTLPTHPLRPFGRLIRYPASLVLTPPSHPFAFPPFSRIVRMPLLSGITRTRDAELSCLHDATMAAFPGCTSLPSFAVASL